MDGKQEFDIIDEDAKELGLAFLFVKYVLPYVVAFLLLAVAIVIGYILYINIDWEESKEAFYMGGTLAVLTLLLVISSKK